METNDILTQAPIVCPEKTVLQDWIDYNGHMNMAFYHVVFDQCVDYLFDALGIGADYLASAQHSVFSREVHVHYLAEAEVGEQLRVTCQLLDFDAKRLHFFEHMYSVASGTLLATSEQLALHVDMTSRKTAPLPADAMQRLAQLSAAQAELPKPDQVGRVMGIRRR